MIRGAEILSWVMGMVGLYVGSIMDGNIRAYRPRSPEGIFLQPHRIKQTIFYISPADEFYYRIAMFLFVLGVALFGACLLYEFRRDRPRRV